MKSSHFSPRFDNRTLWRPAVLAVLSLGALIVARPLRAAEVASSDFAVVAAGDPLYKHLAAVRRATWNATAAGKTSVGGKTGVGSKTGTGSKAANKTAPQAMTRYEMALETARGYFALSARRSADENWMPGTGRGAVRSLRELLSGLRPELRRLNLDVAAAVTFCDALLREDAAPGVAAPAVAPVARPATNLRSATDLRPASRIPLRSAADFNPDQSTLRLPLSQRLRVYAALSALAREANDPFGDASTAAPRRLSGLLASGGSRKNYGLAPGGSMAAGTSFDLANWLRLRAGYSRQELTPGSNRARSVLVANRLPLSLLMTPGATAERTLGGGVDIDLPLGLTVSGDVSRVSPLGLPNSGNDLLRFGGGVGFKAWQNRLSLSANLSRLVPAEDSTLLSNSAAALNLDVGVTERLRLQLLYQELFGSPAQARNGRIIAGGLNFSF